MALYEDLPNIDYVVYRLLSLEHRHLIIIFTNDGNHYLNPWQGSSKSLGIILLIIDNDSSIHWEGLAESLPMFVQRIGMVSIFLPNEGFLQDCKASLIGKL